MNGCWYCNKEDENLAFSWEFDTFVHIECLKNAYQRDTEDVEASIMYKELIEEI